MDNVDKIIYYLEHGQSKDPITEGDPRKVYEAIDDLFDSNKYYYLQFWQNVKEYQRAKLVRSMALPSSSDSEETDINITVVNGKKTE